MNDESAVFILFVLVVGIFGVGVSAGTSYSTNNMTSTQYTQAQEKCHEHEGVYSVGVMKDKVKVFCKDNVEFVMEKK